MAGKTSADDFQAQDFLKKMKRKHKANDKKHENYERETVQNREPSRGRASPLLLEDQPAQNGKGCKKKKKKTYEGEKKQSLLSNWCIGLEHETGDETGVDAFQKKKKKRKYSDGTDGQSNVICVSVNQQRSDGCQVSDSDYVFLKQSVKKKRKEKLPEEDEVCEPPASKPDHKNDNKRSKKKKKKRHSCTQETQEDADTTFDQSLLASPERNSKGEDTASPLPPEQERMTTPQAWREGDYCDTSPMSEDPTDVPASSPKPTETPSRSRKTPVRARKEVKKKSRAFVTEVSSSECEEMTPEPSASNRKKDQNSSFTEMSASDELNLDDEDCVDSVVGSSVDLETAKQELEEFIPHVRTMSNTSIRKMAGRDLMRFKQFKKQGIAVKFGRFSQKENNQIRKNVEEFLLISGIDSAEKLLFTWRYPEEKEIISRLKAEHCFCEKLSQDIPRPWRLIYYRARKMFDPHNYKGRYTEEEKEKLKKYHALHGNDWKKISEMMSRSNLSVAMKYSEIKSPINYGSWSKEEIQKLMRAVEEVFRKRIETEDANSLSSSEKSHRDLLIDREKLLQKLPWTEIEAKVGTRYWRQCKQKWTAILRNKLTRRQPVCMSTKGLEASINLIKRLYEMKVEDANEVKWEELSNIIGDVPGAYVQAKFYKLKVTYVPFWQKKTFSEIIDYLFEEKLPEFEEKLEKKNKKNKNKKQHSSDNSTYSQQKAFRLGDIFDTSDDSD